MNHPYDAHYDEYPSDRVDLLAEASTPLDRAELAWFVRKYLPDFELMCEVMRDLRITVPHPAPSTPVSGGFGTVAAYTIAEAAERNGVSQSWVEDRIRPIREFEQGKRDFALRGLLWSACEQYVIDMGTAHPTMPLKAITDRVCEFVPTYTKWTARRVLQRNDLWESRLAANEQVRRFRNMFRPDHDTLQEFMWSLYLFDEPTDFKAAMVLPAPKPKKRHRVPGETRFRLGSARYWRFLYPEMTTYRAKYLAAVDRDDRGYPGPWVFVPEGAEDIWRIALRDADGDETQIASIIAWLT